jgi:integrase
MRRAEIVALDVEHLKFTRKGLVVTITSSKTDQMHEGQEVAILYGNSEHCPVLAVRKWLDAARIKRGPLFRRIRKGSRLGDRLTGDSVGDIVKAAAVRIGRDGTIYGGHSLRAGCATQIVANGGGLPDVMRQTRHRSTSSAMRYVRVGERFTKNPTALLGL